jgi:dihydropteroate synthase
MREILWKVGEQVVDLSKRGMIMGVLNVTPDSFSDGGKFFGPEQAVAHGMRMASEGAQIIDVGGESTRPGAEPIPTEEELRRVISVIKRLRDKSNVFISVDTSKVEVASAAIDAGASIINDVTGGRDDNTKFSLAAKRNAAFIIMHMQGNPRTMQQQPHYTDVVAEVADFFRQQYDCALECGVDPMTIAVDPGIGFGKTLEHNLELLRNLERLRVKERPLVVGISRKSFLGKLAGSSEMSARLAPCFALTSILRANGANIFRAHDVAENVAALRATEAMLS